MKQLATIGAVVLLLLGAAIYFGQKRETGGPEPIVEPPTPFVDNNDGKPITQARVDGTLVLSSSISNAYLLAGGVRELYAAIDIEAMKYSGGKRPPLNVAIVLDRSGSMSGDKIDKAKAAARRLVNILNENDRVAIVSYGSDVSTNFESRYVTSINRMELLRAIDNISVGGGTNLSGGFQRGYSQVNQFKTSESVNRIVLMSDGHANIGMTAESSIVGLAKTALKDEISVSSIGVGLDYNEDLMTKMANQGAGNYYFVDRPDQIIGFLDQELKGLASTVAKNTKVVVELADGVSLDQLHGFAHERSGNKVFISLSEFYSEQTKNVLMKLRATTDSKGERPIYNVTLNYDDTVKSKPTSQNVKLASVVTADPAKVETEQNIDVVGRVQQVEIATTMQEAMEAYDRGDLGGANKLIDTTKKNIETRTRKFKFAKPKRYKKASKELDLIQGTINSSAPSSTEGKRIIKKTKGRGNDIVNSEVLF